MRWLDGITDCRHEFEQRDGEGKGSLECYSPWGHRELDITEQLSNESTKIENKFPKNIHVIVSNIYAVHYI